MDDQGFIIRFEGAAADQHVIGMRELGDSLHGIERIITTGVHVMRTGRYPNTRTKSPFSVLVSAPRQGSLEILPIMETLAPLFPVVHELYWSRALESARDWLLGVLLKMGGRQSESEELISKALEFAGQVESNRHDEVMAAIELNHGRTARYAMSAVKPVGPYCDSMKLIRSGDEGEVDFPTAEAIRSLGEVEVGDMETMRVLVDGFIHHNRQLKVYHPAEPDRFLTGHIRDPAFDTIPNVYTEAATRRLWLEITAKPTLKDGRIKALYIMDAKIVNNPALNVIDG